MLLRGRPFVSSARYPTVTASIRSSGLELAATDEKNISTSQSATQTHPWFPRPDGNPRGSQRTQAPARQRSHKAGDFDPAQAAGITERFLYPPDARLNQRAEFSHVQRHGVRLQTANFVLYAARQAGCQTIRLGMAVSRRVGNAVVRNRVKRFIREAFRLRLRSTLPAGTALVVIARSGSRALKTLDAANELAGAVQHLSHRLVSSGAPDATE
jgi:ribonuclease P protein component